MRLNELAKYVVLAMMLMPGFAAAVSDDKDQPIHIEADSLDIDDVHGVSIYRGNVQFLQGRRSLAADEVTIHSVEHARVEKVIAVGNPATFRQQPGLGEEEAHGVASRIEYYVQEERLYFQDAAHLWQGENEFAGSRIEYDAKAERVKASKGSDGKGRVQVILQPRKEAKDIPPPNAPTPNTAP